MSCSSRRPRLAGRAGRARLARDARSRSARSGRTSLQAAIRPSAVRSGASIAATPRVVARLLRAAGRGPRRRPSRRPRRRSSSVLAVMCGTSKLSRDDRDAAARDLSRSCTGTSALDAEALGLEVGAARSALRDVVEQRRQRVVHLGLRVGAGGDGHAAELAGRDDVERGRGVVVVAAPRRPRAASAARRPRAARSRAWARELWTWGGTVPAELTTPRRDIMSTATT